MEELTRSEAFVRAVAPLLIHLAEACSVLVILYGIVRALVGFAWNVVRGPTAQVPDGRIRLNLGRALALALEFLLAADILETAIAPSTEALIQLAVVAIIRTGLNYFLGKELEAEARLAEQPLPGPGEDVPRARAVGETVP